MAQVQVQSQQQTIVDVTEITDAILKGLNDPRYDINGDGVVDLADLTALIDSALGPKIPEDGTFIANGVPFRMIDVEGGTFMMGAAITAPGAGTAEKPQHEVTLSSYKIGQTEVTQELWEAVMGSNPSHFKGNPQRPVENVSWEDCQLFIAKLNGLTGMSFRLPTEAEWEYAARGGNKSQGFMFSGSNSCPEVAWLSTNSQDETHPVGERMPNELGIYDMSGLVYEWCQDWHSRYQPGAQINPQGPVTGSAKIYRGGCYEEGAMFCRCTYRYMRETSYRSRRIGLRLAM